MTWQRQRSSTWEFLLAGSPTSWCSRARTRLSSRWRRSRPRSPWSTTLPTAWLSWGSAACTCSSATTPPWRLTRLTVMPLPLHRRLSRWETWWFGLDLDQLKIQPFFFRLHKLWLEQGRARPGGQTQFSGWLWSTWCIRSPSTSSSRSFQELGRSWRLWHSRRTTLSR